MCFSVVVETAQRSKVSGLEGEVRFPGPLDDVVNVEGATVLGAWGLALVAVSGEYC
jgi:hypothetical protein